MENEKNTSILKWLVVMVALGGLLMFENKLSYADIIDNEGNIVLEVNESDISFYNETFDSLLDEGYVTSEDIMVRYPLSIRKVNVKVTTEYSGYTRISDDLKQGLQEEQLSQTKLLPYLEELQVTFLVFLYNLENLHQVQ